MRKFTKVLSVILCLALLSDFAVFPVFAEELPQDEYSVEEDAVLTGAEAEDVAEAVDKTEDVQLPEEDCFEEFTEANADDAELPEEAQTDETDPEEMPEMQEDDAFDPELLGDGENLTYRPYPDASYELKYHILEDKTISIDGYVGNAEGRLILPNTIKRRKVTMIGNRAFASCSGFTGDLIIPNNVTEISDNAFLNCSGFKGKLTIGKNVETIWERAFYNCSSFRGDLIIPDSVTEIRGEAFYNCSGFDGTLTIGKNVELISGHAFMNCNGFRGDLIIPDSVKEIRDDAFNNCSGF
ncbi:MAG: leucine-rich repeat protein [Lachnospiraceae bacterium]|nr:leucine-rich repeat protein [Lachnospiraceae bacterium]